MTQHDLDLITDTKAFNPDPIRIEAPGWLTWLAGVGFIILFAALVLMA